MNATERKRQIVELLRQRESVDVVSLSSLFGTSRVTIRNDLNALENKGILVRTRGGAILAENQTLVRLVSNTIHEHTLEKHRIAEIACRLIEPGMNVIIDSGSTTVHLADVIPDIPIAVVTNSMLVVQSLACRERIELVIAGGVLRRQSMSTIGAEACRCFGQIHADLLFFGASGFSLDQGITCSNLIEADVKKAMIRSACRTVLMIDSTKTEVSSFARICGWESVDVLITDRIEPRMKDSLMQKGVMVLTE